MEGEKCFFLFGSSIFVGCTVGQGDFPLEKAVHRFFFQVFSEECKRNVEPCLFKREYLLVIDLTFLDERLVIRSTPFIHILHLIVRINHNYAEHEERKN